MIQRAYHTIWKPMDPRDSGIFRLASVGSYLDALSTITDEMSLKERSNLIFLDRCLHERWGLGENVILNWCPEGDGIALLDRPALRDRGLSRAPQPDSPARGALSTAEAGVLPGAAVGPALPDAGAAGARSGGCSASSRRICRCASRSRTPRGRTRSSRRWSSATASPTCPNRGVCLFDIVGFSLLPPFEQMMQLNSLSYSLNSAQSKLLTKRIGVDFSRTTTGDGFYIWNRDLTLEGNVNLYHFMQLALADNAIAHKKAQHNTVPRLRACFHVGSSYEFHQVGRARIPTLYNYIVGDVTVDLARIIERAMPGQILVGDFRSEMPTVDAPGGESRIVESADFVELAMRNVEQLAGIELSGERVDAIRCYLTGTKLANGEFTVRRITVNDKHGIARRVYNAKVNIYRHNAEPILLGIEDRVARTRRRAGIRQRAGAAAGARLSVRSVRGRAPDLAGAAPTSVVSGSTSWCGVRGAGARLARSGP